MINHFSNNRRTRSTRRKRREGFRFELLEDRRLLAATVPDGTETLVNDFTPNTQQTRAETRAIAGNASGDLIVAFDGRGPDGFTEIYARRYDSTNAPEGGQFLVNTTTSGNQKYPSAALGSGGESVVAWSGKGTGDNDGGVFFQRFDNTGATVGGETRVNETTASTQEKPVVAKSSDGTFIVVWSGRGAGDAIGVFARRFDTNGTPLTGEFLVNTTTTLSQNRPDVAFANDGSYAISWDGNGPGDSSGIFYQAFDSADAAVGVETRVNTTANGGQTLSSVAIDQALNVWVTWSGFGNAAGNADSRGVFLRGFDSSGTALTGETLVNTTTAFDQEDASITADANGLVVTWTSIYQDGSTRGVYRQEFDNSGVKVDGESLVNTTTSGDQRFSSVAARGGNRYAVAFSGKVAGDSAGVSFQSFQRLVEAGSIEGSGAVIFTDGGGVVGAGVTASVESGPAAVETTGSEGDYTVTANGLAPGQFRVDVSAVVDGVPLSSTRYGFVPDGSNSIVLDPIELPNPATTQLFPLGGGDFTDFDEVQVIGLPAEVASVYAEAFDQQTEPNAFPGLVGDAAGNAFNSTVFAWLLALDAAGNEVSTFPDPVTVRLRISENQHVDVFDLTPGNGQIDVPMYSFDDVSGQWVIEATGIITDSGGAPYPETAAANIRAGVFGAFDVYAQFETDHFSYWNLDYKKTDFPGSGDPNFYDFGDAGGANVAATYPTTLAQDGARHSDPNRLWLGQWADSEADANVVDADEFDDGLLSFDPISVRVNNWDVPGNIYLNVLIDRNDDGDWDDAGEWAVQNAITGTPIFKGESFDTTESWDPVNEGALRLTVTDVPITDYDGTGAFDVGETEDYLDPPPGDLLVDVIGGGTVTSDVGGIDCPGVECLVEIVGGSAVTLTATPEPNREFLGWGFGECFDRGTNPTCTVIVDGNSFTYVDAVFSENLVRAFSLAPGSPTLAANGWSPADVLLIDEDAGAVTRLFTAAELGLAVADDIDALNFPFFGPSPRVSPNDSVFAEYSVTEESAGAPGTHVETEAACADGDLGADIWALTGFGGSDGGPDQWVDENGVNCSTNHPFAAAGLLPGDEIDAWTRIDLANPGEPYYSLAPGSPTLTANGWSAADILESEDPGTVTVDVVVWADAESVGLDPSDDIDALAGQLGIGRFNEVHLSLAAGSTSLAANGWNATYVLTTSDFGGGFNPLFINLTEFELGLLDTDDLDALDLFFGGFNES